MNIKGPPGTKGVVVRFAPSPTGFLHIGGARTALFNWLYRAPSRRAGFRLRIEDTDRQRSTPEAVAAIIDGLAWLGLDWDGEIVHQFARAAAPCRGRARSCWPRAAPITATARPAELEAMRERARAEKRSVRYDGTWRDRDPAEAPAGRRAGDPPARRRRTARRRSATSCRARSRSRNAELDDLILLRADGTPTYNLSVVVDDHDMGITHVIRGDDHLNNAFRQTQIYRALDWPVPEFAHVPLIHGADGAKMSKRHGAIGVEQYRELGYLPEALRNYLLRLGWSHGDDEIIATEDAIGWFDIDDVGRGAARFDQAKLDSVNAPLHPRGRRRAARRPRRRAAGEGVRRRAVASRARAPAARRCPGSSRAPRRLSSWPRRPASMSRRGRSARRRRRRSC